MIDHLQISKDNQNDNNNFICYNNKYNSVCKIKTENSLLENNSNENKSETDNENSDKKINNKMNDSTIESIFDIKGEDVKYKDDRSNPRMPEPQPGALAISPRTPHSNFYKIITV